MNIKVIIKGAIGIRGTSAISLSRKMGKSDGYINSIINRDNSPSVNTLEEIANALGYDMHVVWTDRKTGAEIKL